MKLAVTQTVSCTYTHVCLQLFFFKPGFPIQGWQICFFFFFAFSVLVHWATDPCTECFPERYSHSSTSVHTPLFPAPLPLWLINPLSIIWSQSITPFYRLSGGITISLSRAPLRMADPYQTEAMPWTKEPLWSSLHSATNVSISTGCCCPLLLHDCLNRAEISLPSRQRKSLMNADDTVQGGGGGWQGCRGAGIPGHWPWLCLGVQAGYSFLKIKRKGKKILLKSSRYKQPVLGRTLADQVCPPKVKNQC